MHLTSPSHAELNPHTQEFVVLVTRNSAHGTRGPHCLVIGGLSYPRGAYRGRPYVSRGLVQSLEGFSFLRYKFTMVTHFTFAAHTIVT